MGRVRRPRGGLRPAAGLWGPPVGTGRARRSGAGPRPPAPRRPTRGPRRAQKGRGYQASPRCWFPSTALQPTPNPCLVLKVFLAELGRQITLLAINDCPPEDDDYDWQQNQRPQCVRQECQTGRDEDEAEIHRVSSEPIGTADSQGGRRPRRMTGGADPPERCDRPDGEGQPRDQAERAEESKWPNEYGRDYGQRELPVKKEAKEQATQVDQRWKDPYARAIIGCAAHVG